MNEVVFSLSWSEILLQEIFRLQRSDFFLYICCQNYTYNYFYRNYNNQLSYQ